MQYENYLTVYLAEWIKYTELEILMIHCNLWLTAVKKVIPQNEYGVTSLLLHKTRIPYGVDGV